MLLKELARVEKVNRKSLIIGCPGTPGTDGFLPGVQKDVASYEKFLLSPLGGAWLPAEVKTLVSPSKDAVLAEIETLKRAEYSFVVFAGHACHDATRNDTVLQLKHGVEMRGSQLKIGAPRHTLILDCCREVARPISLSLESVLAKADRMPVALNASECRKYFDQRVQEAGAGLATLYACSVDETADESSDGGFYSSSLIAASAAWHKESTTDTAKNFSIFSIVKAHEAATSEVAIMSGGRQHPKIERPRSQIVFPFAVIA